MDALLRELKQAREIGMLYALEREIRRATQLKKKEKKKTERIKYGKSRSC